MKAKIRGLYTSNLSDNPRRLEPLLNNNESTRWTRKDPSDGLKGTPFTPILWILSV